MERGEGTYVDREYKLTLIHSANGSHFQHVMAHKYAHVIVHAAT